MTQFPVNPQRVDPYKNFKFLVYWGGQTQPVAGVSKVSPLVRKTEVIFHRSGGDMSTSHKSPGRTEYEAITLERGVTQDPAFEQWASKVWNYGGSLGMEVSLADFRKSIRIELLNEAGQVVMAYNVYRCWVSEYQALPELDSDVSRIAFQYIKVENEGWVRDVAVTEPKEPQFTPE